MCLQEEVVGEARVLEEVEEELDGVGFEGEWSRILGGGEGTLAARG